MSTSLWGRELKGQLRCFRKIRRVVDLLVRSWIERWKQIYLSRQVERRPPCEVVNWKTFAPTDSNIVTVDLLVRSWIERLHGSHETGSPYGRPPCEVVNWKIYDKSWKLYVSGRPPCEVVNWKDLRFKLKKFDFSRPPCEVVNWKRMCTRLWGYRPVDLLVRSWIERLIYCSYYPPVMVDLLVRSWIES